jgi:hypothetical protein
MQHVRRKLRVVGLNDAAQPLTPVRAVVTETWPLTNEVKLSSVFGYVFTLLVALGLSVAWLTVGEGWHRNHHAAENPPRLGIGHQLDLGWIAISALRHLRLARITTRGIAGLNRLLSLYPAATITVELAMREVERVAPNVKTWPEVSTSR